MIKYFDSCVTFQEFPDEISLLVNITNCPCRCEGCCESYLQDDIGNELTFEEVDKLIDKNKGITLFGFMGGDIDHETLMDISDYIKDKYPNLKIGVYSGLDYVDLVLAEYVDYYKIGRFIMVESSNEYGGPINCPNSNQIMFKKVDDRLINITERFRKNQVNNISNFVVK